MTSVFIIVCTFVLKPWSKQCCLWCIWKLMILFIYTKCQSWLYLHTVAINASPIKAKIITFSENIFLASSLHNWIYTSDTPWIFISWIVSRSGVQEPDKGVHHFEKKGLSYILQKVYLISNKWTFVLFIAKLSGAGLCFRLCLFVCMFVCLCVTKLSQECVDIFQHYWLIYRKALQFPFQ